MFSVAPCTKFILSLPYQTNISYKERLQILDLIPLCYWHEYLDIVYIFKNLIKDPDNDISVKVSIRETRSASNGIFLNVRKCRTDNYQNSYYIRAAKVWNTLPSNIRDTTKSLSLTLCTHAIGQNRSRVFLLPGNNEFCECVIDINA